MATRETLKGYFASGRYPTAEEFAELIETFLTPADKVGLEQVTGLATALAYKLSVTEGRAISDNISHEVTRATSAEATLVRYIADEVTRAKAAEVANTTAITKEVIDRVAAVATVTTRAEAAEVAVTNCADKALLNTPYYNMLRGINGHIGATSTLGVTTAGCYVYYTGSEYTGLLLVSYSAGMPMRQVLMTADGVWYRGWDYSAGNMGGDWSPIWVTRIVFEDAAGGSGSGSAGVRAAVTGDNTENLTLEIANGAAVMGGDVLVFTAYATVFDEGLIIA